MATRSPSLRDGFGRLVSRTARQWRRAADRRLQPMGLTEATWLPLLHVARARTPLRQKDLAADLAVDNSTVVRLLDELQANGLVERREGDDRRAKVIMLTASGRAIVTRVEREIQAMRKEVLAGVSEPDLRTAYAVLEQVFGALGGEEP